MPRIDLPEDWAVRNLRQWVRDSLMSHGEQAIALCMYRASTDENTVRRCQACFDDVYNQGDQDCTNCWGTSFDGGIRTATRVWALFTDNETNEETREKHGVYNPDKRQVQTEYPPPLCEHDYLVRIRRWNSNGTIPLEVEGFYLLGKVDPTSLRTGNRFGQSSQDMAGQIAPVAEISPSSHIITKYPVIGKTFVRLDGRPR